MHCLKLRMCTLISSTPWESRGLGALSTLECQSQTFLDSGRWVIATLFSQVYSGIALFSLGMISVTHTAASLTILGGITDDITSMGSKTLSLKATSPLAMKCWDLDRPKQGRGSPISSLTAHG